eukprot:3687995-Prymnesium_polylepis.1
MDLFHPTTPPPNLGSRECLETARRPRRDSRGTSGAAQASGLRAQRVSLWARCVSNWYKIRLFLHILPPYTLRPAPHPRPRGAPP